MNKNIEESNITEEIKKINQMLKGRMINFGTVCYMILKTLELRELGLTSKEFEEQKTIFKEECE